jgi:hypothetical protein
MEEYNDTRRWRCYEAALLMKKNEIRTDEEAPLTTPVDASVLEYYRASPANLIGHNRPPQTCCVPFAERIYDIHTTYPLHLTTVRTYTLKLPYHSKES